jgi:hypothetical protein
MKTSPWQRLENLKTAFNMKPTIGHILEFGVGEGRSLRFLTRLTSKTIFGFDSFDGLPEDWVMSDTHTYEAGSFKYDPPSIKGVKYVPGWFKDTIPTWKSENPGMVSFMHIDSDIYSSAVTILTELNHQIVPGTILVFDDMYGTELYQNWEQGEYKAFNEWRAEFGREVFEINHTEDGEASFRVLK